MEAERRSISVSPSPRRWFKRDDVTWVVREADGRGVPGAKGSVALVFDCPHTTRRVWVFPRNWHQLDEIDLWTVSERSGRISTKFELRSHELSSTLCACLVSMNRAQELCACAKTA